MEEHKGRTKTMDAGEIYDNLMDILDCGVMELCRVPGRDGSIFVPYMMNDAIEYYLELTDAQLLGDYDPDEEITDGYLETTDEGYILHAFQEQNAADVTFSTIKPHAATYQYHRIGHYWVRGEEKWRRLTYIIGTILDKYLYFGDRFCNEDEMAIMHLIEFAPFRYWSPIDESLDGRYEETVEGYETMMALAEEAGDGEYLKLLKNYPKHRDNQLMIDLLSKALLAPEREALYELICRKINTASSRYPGRNYDEASRIKMDELRRSADARMRAMGFGGSYPEYTSEDGKRAALLTEEHPFTVLDWEDFGFSISAMIWESSDPMKTEILKII